MRNENDDNRSVALYWDFENLHAALAEAKFGDGSYSKPDARFKPQEVLVDVQAIVELGASFGRIAIDTIVEVRKGEFDHEVRLR